MELGGRGREAKTSATFGTARHVCRVDGGEIELDVLCFVIRVVFSLDCVSELIVMRCGNLESRASSV